MRRAKVKVRVERLSWQEAYQRFRMPPEKPIMQLWAFTRGSQAPALEWQVTAKDMPDLLCDSCNTKLADGDAVYLIEDDDLWCEQCFNRYSGDWIIEWVTKH